MRLGVTDHIDCAHLLPGHPKCGQLHGHTYRVEVTVRGELRDGMVLDFAELKAGIRSVLERYDHRNWNDFLDYPTVENICERLARELGARVRFPFSIRVHEGHAKWAETEGGPVPRPGSRKRRTRRP
jgi:6-pyruvoyltetrahydropterin/6-carboxytetrahydropterin synthase